MLLKSDRKTRKHRNKKRQIEIDKIISVIRNKINYSSDLKSEKKILEFGCGNGFQIPYLQQVGQVFATDIYISDELKNLTDNAFCVSDIKNLPYPENAFDVIFSNHVIEHLPNPDTAFQELKRVASEECLFVFSLPTNVWLLLSLPSKYLGKISALFQILKNRFNKYNNQGVVLSADIEERQAREKMLGADSHEKEEKITLKKAVFPKGHGVHQKFCECYRAFRIKNWAVFLKIPDSKFCQLLLCCFMVLRNDRLFQQLLFL